MSRKWRLAPEDREILSIFSRATFSNPFGEERDELFRRLPGTAGAGSRRELLDTANRVLIDRIRRLEEEGAHVSRCPAEDVDLLKSILLFETYHRYSERFRELILQQEKAGDAPCPVPFARECLSSLLKRGFSEEEALRFFALFFQIGRAFHFIDHGLVGCSRSMRTVRLHLWNSVFTKDIKFYALHLWNRMEDFSVLILGDTGSGKGTAAAAIGRSAFIPFDPRRGCFAESFTRNFIAINLSQYPKGLIESALFGHKKGAFTGAIEHYDGVFSRCSPHGAILLDEIGDVAVPIQIKLLQVIQERTFSPVGGNEQLRFRGRVLAATNQPLTELRRRGRFRRDFYYRLCSDIVEMPSLSHRIQENPKELPYLVSHVLRQMIGEPPPGLFDSVCAALRRDVGPTYPWPGNVRELEQAVRRIILTGRYTGDADGLQTGLLDRIKAGLESGTMAAPELLASYCQLLYQRHGTFEGVARRTGLDRRTAKRYVQRGPPPSPGDEPPEEG
jgi:transcriptional regulator with AAA-type ATPase domain